MAIAMAGRRKQQLWPTTMNKALCYEHGRVRSTCTEINSLRMKKRERQRKDREEKKDDK